MKGLDAIIALNALLWAEQFCGGVELVAGYPDAGPGGSRELWSAGPSDAQEGFLREPPAATYGSTIALEEMESAELLRLVRTATEILSARGDNLERFCGAGGFPAVERAAPERIAVSSDYRIRLPDRGGEEIELLPLPKTLFIFFLKHPEGVSFTNLAQYRHELFGIYSSISHRLDPEGMMASIDKITSLESNSFHSQKSKLASALARYFDASALGQYIIKGSPDSRSAIALSPCLVEWQ